MRNIFLIAVFVYQLSACTIFHTQIERGATLVGRNFDWDKEGGRINIIPATKTNYGRVTLSQTPSNMPYEGMNDQGLFIAVSALEHTNTTTSLLKPIVKSLEMVDIVLKNAANIDEAIAEFNNYSIAFGEFLGYPLIHYKIVDKTGNSVVVEFDNGIKVIKDQKISQIMANHYLNATNKLPKREDSLQRTKIVRNALQSIESVDDLFKILNKVSTSHTLWSSVYNLQTQTLYFKYKNEPLRTFHLKEELYKHRKPIYYDAKDPTKTKKIENSNEAFTIRPHFGFGNKGSAYFGARVLLNANQTKKYGLEITKFNTNDDDFLIAGIVLEQRLFRWFNMSIGTLGYFDYGKNDENIAGLTTNLG